MAKKSTNYQKLKPPYQPQVFKNQTEFQHFVRCMNDPLYFIENFVWVQNGPQGRSLFKAFDFQRELIQTYFENMYTIAMLPRQSGKSTTAAGYLLWYAMFHSDVTVLLASNKFDSANEIMQRLKYAYEEIPDYIRPGVVGYNVKSIQFDNGSRILAQTTTKGTGRGFTIDLLYCDEFAHIQPQIATEFWSGIQPTLATSKGKCIITSTPLSDEDLFAGLWQGATHTTDASGNPLPKGVGINGFKAFSAHYSQFPGRDEEWAQQQRSQIGDERFDREFCCKFGGEESTLLTGLALRNLGQGIEPLIKTGEIRWYDKIDSSKIYLVGLDPSHGIGQDSACVAVWSLPDMVQVAEWSHDRTPVSQQVKIFQTIINSLYHDIKRQGYKGEPEIFYTLENNSVGMAALEVISDIGEENFLGQFLHEPKKIGTPRHTKGLNTNGKTKNSACVKLKSLIENNRLNIKSKMLIAQLKFFVASKGSYAAKTGYHDDCVSATLLCVRLMQLVTNWDDRVGEILKDVFDDAEDTSRDPMPFAIMIN